MQIGASYSHLNGEEYLLVHHKDAYHEVLEVIRQVDAEHFRTKRSKEARKQKRLLYNPKALNRKFDELLKRKKWQPKHYSYFVSKDHKIMREAINLPPNEQKGFLIQKGETPLKSYKRTDFVKDGIAIEVQFGKYSFIAYDLFVKHLLFYSGNVINVGVEVLPMKSMQSEMSSGIAYYEGELANVLRHGRGSPPVPLVLIGIMP